MASHLSKTTPSFLEVWGLWKQAFAAAAHSLGLPDILVLVAAVDGSRSGCPQQENNKIQDELMLQLEVLDPAPVRRKGQRLEAYGQDIHNLALHCSQAYLRNEARVDDYQLTLEAEAWEVACQARSQKRSISGLIPTIDVCAATKNAVRHYETQPQTPRSRKQSLSYYFLKPTRS